MLNPSVIFSFIWLDRGAGVNQLICLSLASSCWINVMMYLSVDHQHHLVGQCNAFSVSQAVCGVPACPP